MNKKISTCILTCLFVFTTSCSSTVHYDKECYQKTINYSDNFKIMQLTDIHFSLPTNMDEQFKYLKKNIEACSPNLIAITGDSFFGASKKQVDLFFDFFDYIGVPYAFVNGNHDHQGSYESYYVEERLNKSKVALFTDFQNDDLPGNMNYYIDIIKDDKPLYRLFMIDGGSYVYNGKLSYDYDIIKDEQIAHFEDIQTKDNETVPALAFFHIPLYEFNTAYQLYLKGEIPGNGENGEEVKTGYKNNNQFQKFKNMGVKGIFVGHDHVNNSNLFYEEVVLSYGVKSTNQIYHDDNKIGYKEIILPADGKFDLSCVKNVFVKE